LRGGRPHAPDVGGVLEVVIGFVRQDRAARRRRIHVGLIRGYVISYDHRLVKTGNCVRELCLRHHRWRDVRNHNGQIGVAGRSLAKCCPGGCHSEDVRRSRTQIVGRDGKLRLFRVRNGYVIRRARDLCPLERDRSDS